MILVDGGDFCPQPTEPEKIKAQLIREIMDRMHYDILAVGERELGYGYDFYKSMMEGTKMEVLAANVTHGDKDRLGDEFFIVNAGGVKVGFVNVFANNAVSGRMDVFEKQGYKLEDPLEVLNLNLAKVRANSDFVILLAHAPWGQLNDMLKEVSGIDFVIAVHEGGIDRKPREMHGTVLMRPGSRGQHLCTLTFVVDPEGNVKSLEADAVNVKTSLPEDPEIAAMIKATTERYNETRRTQTISEVSEHAEKLKGDKYLGDGICRRCHEDIYQLWLDTPHAVAFERLVEKGMERDSDCIGCHTTGHGQPTGYVIPPAVAAAAGGETPRVSPGTPDLKNVQCEACHGMGTYHQREGGVFLEVTDAECSKCHNAEHSPEFNYKDYLPHVSCTALAGDS